MGRKTCQIVKHHFKLLQRTQAVERVAVHRYDVVEADIPCWHGDGSSNDGNITGDELGLVFARKCVVGRGPYSLVPVIHLLLHHCDNLGGTYHVLSVRLADFISPLLSYTPRHLHSPLSLRNRQRSHGGTYGVRAIVCDKPVPRPLTAPNTHWL